MAPIGRLHTANGHAGHNCLRELSIQTLGGLRLFDRSGQEIRIASRKGRALLAYLAVRLGEPHSRDHLATLLWEDTDEELARSSLRQALASIRKALPRVAHAALRADAECIALNAELTTVDLDMLRGTLKATATIDVRSLLDQYRGELLAGLEARSAAFEDWLSNERLALRRQVTSALQQLTALCLANDDVDNALAACARLVALEPLDEAAHRTLMELHARRNAYSEALRQYRRCREALRRELDVAPEPATEALYRELIRRRRAGHGQQEDLTRLQTSPVDTSQSTEATTRPALRDAVVSVARLDGLLELEASADPEESLAVIDQFAALARAAAEAFGGRVDRRSGANILSVFGVPSVYGNEAERASRAALALQQAFARHRWPAHLAFKLRIGLAQGQVLSSAELFPLTGKPTHVAHALAAHAPEQHILISDEVRQTLGERAEVTRMEWGPPAAPAWRLDGMASHARPSEPFVGRRPELAMILAVLERCATSQHGRAVVVRGEAGIGKTCLVEAIRAVAQARDIAVHRAQVFNFGQSPGRRPITTLALSLCDVTEEASPAERARAVQRIATALQSSLDQIVFLSDLIDAPLAPELSGLEQAMDAQTRQRGRARVLTQLIESNARRCPMLIIVEDVHWATNDELERLGEIAAVITHCPALFVVTTRPEDDPISTTWRARARNCPVTTVDLAPLADDEAHELAAHYQALPPELIEACIRRAEGHPLFLDQLLRAASAGHDALPGSVRSLVIARADRLSSRDQQALQAAAVLGQRCNTDALHALLDDPSFEPGAMIDAGLMRADGIDLQFTHALFRDAIYESILKSHRTELHLRAAQWFRTRDAALHADHLAAAHDEGACEAYFDAARAEQDALRFERALALATRANTLAHNPAWLQRTCCLIGELLLQLGRTHDALTSYREALDFAVDPPSRGAAYFGIAASLRIMDRYEEALDALAHAEQALGADTAPQMKARISSLRGNLCFPLGQVDACLRAHEQAQRHAEQAGTPLELARALGGIGDAWYQRGHIVSAHRHFQLCIDEARRHGLTSVLLANLPMLSVTHHFCCELHAATQAYEEGLELVRHIGDRRCELLLHLVAASTLLMRGRYADSKRHAMLVIDVSQRVGARRFHAEARGVVAHNLLCEGDRVEALRFANEGLAIARDSAMSYCGATLLGIVAHASHNPLERGAAFREGEALLANGSVSHTYFDFYQMAIESGLAARDWAEVRRCADALQRYTSNEPVPWAQLLIERALLLADIGEGRSTPAMHASLDGLLAHCQRIDAGVLLPRIERARTAHY